MNVKKTLLAMLLSCLALCSADAQVVTESGKLDPATSRDLQAFKAKVQQAHPDYDVISVDADVVKRAVLAPKPKPPRKTPVMAIFVKNNTRVPGMDDEVDGIRDRLAAELAGMNFVILDQAEIASSFNRYKITTAEERAGLIAGLFSGGSTTRIAQMLGTDYILLASINRASSMNRMAGDRPVSIYTLRMSTKVLDATTGGSVYGGNWTRKLPSPSGDPNEAMNYYNDLIDQYVADTGAQLSQTSARWRQAVPDTVPLVQFSVSTIIDQMIMKFEPGTLTTQEIKEELRQVVGGVTIELDGAAIGTSPGTFMAKPGLHQLRITRQWMNPWQKTVNIQNGSLFNIALELSPAGFNEYRNMERLRADLAIRYAEAALRRGAKINFDTAGWRDVTTGGNGDKRAVIVQ